MICLPVFTVPYLYISTLFACFIAVDSWVEMTPLFLVLGVSEVKPSPFPV